MMTESHPSASSEAKRDFQLHVKDSWMEDEGHSSQPAIFDMASDPQSAADATSSSTTTTDGDDDDDSSAAAAWEKSRERRAVVAGVAGGVAGLVLLGPVYAVGAGVAGALISKRMSPKKEELTFETARNETELASLLTPKPQI